MIFDNLAKINKSADESEDQLRVSFDAKVAVKIGNLSRGGKSRKTVHADDHDFGVLGTTTPVALYLPKEKDLFFYIVESKVTSDCCVDIMEDWWKHYSLTNTKVKTLILNMDNGPQQQSYTRQFMKRIQEFTNKANIQIQLAYYPPYHSKYNPVERTLGALEKHWSSEILDTKDKVVGFASSMTWCGKNPKVSVMKKTYETGVKVGKEVMNKLQAGFHRTIGIEKYSVLITPQLDSG